LDLLLPFLVAVEVVLLVLLVEELEDLVVAVLVETLTLVLGVEEQEQAVKEVLELLVFMDKVVAVAVKMLLELRLTVEQELHG
jgi:hypothetical protein